MFYHNLSSHAYHTYIHTYIQVSPLHIKSQAAIREGRSAGDAVRAVQPHDDRGQPRAAPDGHPAAPRICPGHIP